jgi:hypothetical protein
MTTATKLTPAEMLKLLQDLLNAGVDYATAEHRIETLFAEIREHEDDLVDGLSVFEPAVHAQVMAATRPLTDDMREASMVCDEILEAIEVLRFAIERNGDAS